MCCCGKPVVNGELGYKWQPNDTPMVRQPHMPEMQSGDVLLYDEPGRCGGVDSHHMDCRLVDNCGLYLLVRHGGGEERIHVSSTRSALKAAFEAMDSNARYWVFAAIQGAHSDGADEAQKKESTRWRTAAAQKRIKTQKQRGRDAVKVWIED